MAKLDLDILEKLRQYAKTDVISTLCDLITKEIIILLPTALITS